jgi:hypothetical protein
MFDEYYTELVSEAVRYRLLYGTYWVPISDMTPIILTDIFIIFSGPPGKFRDCNLDRPQSPPSESFPIYHSSYNSKLHSLRREQSHGWNHRRAEYCSTSFGLLVSLWNRVLLEAKLRSGEFPALHETRSFRKPLGSAMSRYDPAIPN